MGLLPILGTYEAILIMGMHPPWGYNLSYNSIRSPMEGQMHGLN
jgi:hypothetical protein